MKKEQRQRLYEKYLKLRDEIGARAHSHKHGERVKPFGSTKKLQEIKRIKNRLGKCLSYFSVDQLAKLMDDHSRAFRNKVSKALKQKKK